MLSFEQLYKAVNMQFIGHMADTALKPPIPEDPFRNLAENDRRNTISQIQAAFFDESGFSEESEEFS